MGQTNKNSIAALLSHVVRAVFWISIFVLIGGVMLIGTGIVGSVNGGAVKLPWIEALAQNVPLGRLVTVLVGVVIFATGTAYVCGKLRRILSTLAEGDPFVPENGPRLMRIALAIGFVEVVRIVSVVIIAMTVDLGQGYSIAVDLNLTAWGAVLTLLILAQVFREGSRLREEEKMTI